MLYWMINMSSSIYFTYQRRSWMESLGWMKWCIMNFWSVNVGFCQKEQRKQINLSNRKLLVAKCFCLNDSWGSWNGYDFRFLYVIMYDRHKHRWNTIQKKTTKNILFMISITVLPHLININRAAINSNLYIYRKGDIASTNRNDFYTFWSSEVT